MPSFEPAHLFVVALTLLGIGLLAHLFYTLWRANRYSKTDLESMEAPAEELTEETPTEGEDLPEPEARSEEDTPDPEP